MDQKNHCKDICENVFVKKNQMFSYSWKTVVIVAALVSSGFGYTFIVDRIVSTQAMDIAVLKRQVDEYRAMREDIKAIKDAVLRKEK